MSVNKSMTVSLGTCSKPQDSRPFETTLACPYSKTKKNICCKPD